MCTLWIVDNPFKMCAQIIVLLILKKHGTIVHALVVFDKKNLMCHVDDPFISSVHKIVVLQKIIDSPDLIEKQMVILFMLIKTNLLIIGILII